MKRSIGVAIFSFFATSLVFNLGGCATSQKGALYWAQGSYKKGDYQACLEELGRAEAYGDFSEAVNAEISFYKGLCLEGRGRKAEAEAVYQNLIKKYPNSDWSAQARARIGR